MQSAVQNNARWCDIVCRSHGKPGKFLPEIWLNRSETPPFYPNAVTLTPDETAAQISHIADLLTAGVPGEWGVKDSYCTLDLMPLGFRQVFEGAWIYRDALADSTSVHGVTGVRWTRVTGDKMLARWEMAWQGTPGDLTVSHPNRIFLPSLLTEDGIAIIAGLSGEQVVAGAVVTHADSVVGISNLFLPPSGSRDVRAGCVAHVQSLFPHLPLVGYEGGHDLAEMLALGFESVGPVRIWVRSDGSRE